MRYHVGLKFLAILLCACCLLAALGTIAGIVILVEGDLYNQELTELREEQIQQTLSRSAGFLARRYAASALGNCSEEIVSYYYQEYYGTVPVWCYTITEGNGRIVDFNHDQAIMESGEKYEQTVTPTYPVVLGYELRDRYTGEVLDVTIPTSPDPTTEAVIPGTVSPAPEGSEYLYMEHWSYSDRSGRHVYTFGFLQGPTYRVTLYAEPDDLLSDPWLWELAAVLYDYRYDLFWILGAALLLFAASLIYLCCAAGRKPRTDEIAPGGLNRLPLDLYGTGAGLAIMGLAVICYELVIWNANDFQPLWLLALAVLVMGYLACLLAVAFLFACAAQFKMKNFYWAKHSLVGLCLGLCFKIAKKLLGWLRKVLGRLFGILRRSISLLPLTWQWLLMGFVMTLMLIICLVSRSPSALLLGICVFVLIILYGAHCFGTLMESAKRMSQGDLDTKVKEGILVGSFRDFAGHLNALADVVVEAAQKQMRSERMKAELVTNVSHDIKTPLTSIINYVDLLRSAQSQEEAQGYLEVLSRQSQRLKKLIEDLMEMSKASTGNMAVELSRVDAREAIHQALGEFSEKLEAANLIPVFDASAAPVFMTADGRLTWRVLSNLLSNAVKYAMPGTRLYVDLSEQESHVLISLKNISAQQLNISSQELLERFVRGDASRNTEGSGLGLNIAKSLMELQGGRLELLVDGDLFKVTLVFPKIAS